MALKQKKSVVNGPGWLNDTRKDIRVYREISKILRGTYRKK